MSVTAKPYTDWVGNTEVIEDYFQGMYQSDGARLRRAFHANARIAGHGSDGGFNELTVEQFARFAEKQQPSAAAKGAMGVDDCHG